MRTGRRLAAFFAAGALSLAALSGAANAAPDSALLVISKVTNVKCLVTVKGHAHVGATERDNLAIRLFGEDLFGDDELVREGPFSTALNGDYSAVFTVACKDLDEDPVEPDEIFAVAQVFDPSTGVTKKIRSNTVTGIF
ncbi:hypothetical protein [Nonomuraea endophytica]|uniref:Uncharacterized protein n=1 Tax=Nonomuraea endophytica TaxID=714136 RepID=A0A7W8A765_9ACTN|nr:hypothetical protein [Nonomuraea endophytica]MBB5079896.1 hypothetical protein [Nonomuraea endophytica]